MLVALLNISIVIITFIIMEFVAWTSHKYLMHGFLWSLHKDHHDHTTPPPLEFNDFFALIFAIPSCIFIILGIIDNWNYKFYIGLGILIYGIAYFFVHEVIIHQRIKWFSKLNNTYVKGIRRAHKIHHKKLGKENDENFGMLFVSLKYFKEQI